MPYLLNFTCEDITIKRRSVSTYVSVSLEANYLLFLKGCYVAIAVR